MDTENQYMNVKETAEMLRRSPGWVYHSIKNDVFPKNLVIKIGRGYLINKHKLDKWLSPNGDQNAGNVEPEVENLEP